MRFTARDKYTAAAAAAAAVLSKVDGKKSNNEDARQLTTTVKSKQGHQTRQHRPTLLGAVKNKHERLLLGRSSETKKHKPQARKPPPPFPPLSAPAKKTVPFLSAYIYILFCLCLKTFPRYKHGPLLYLCNRFADGCDRAQSELQVRLEGLHVLRAAKARAVVRDPRRQHLKLLHLKVGGGRRSGVAESAGRRDSAS